MNTHLMKTVIRLGAVPTCRKIWTPRVAPATEVRDCASATHHTFGANRRLVLSLLAILSLVVLGTAQATAGTFAAAINYGAGADPFSVAVGDFNGDGKPDLAVANSAFDGGTSNVSILLGNGDGAFQAAVNYGAGAGPISVAVGDFDGNGKPDLAVANSALAVADREGVKR